MPHSKKTMVEVLELVPMRLLACCLMPNHQGHCKFARVSESPQGRGYQSENVTQSKNVSEWKASFFSR